MLDVILKFVLIGLDFMVSPRIESYLLMQRRPVWIFEQIGAPLKFITTFVDQRMGISRPAEERKQILTNASKFKSRRDQEISIELVTGAFKRYGGFFGSDAIFARETPGAVEFSKELQESILNGELLSG